MTENKYYKPAKDMNIVFLDREKIKNITSFAKKNKVSRQYVYECINKGMTFKSAKKHNWTTYLI